MAARIAALDWSKTSVGAMAGWPQSLRTTVSIMLNTRFPMFLFWGPDAVGLYNDAYRPILGSHKHPGALGQQATECWADIWDIVGPQIEAVMARGEQTWFEDQLVPFERSGFLEEIYFTYSYSPVYDESGDVGGALVVCSETTERVLAERWLRVLHQLSGYAGDDVEPALVMIRTVLAAAELDLPMALLYRVDDEQLNASLVWSLGVEPDLPASPSVVDLRDVVKGTSWPVASVVETGVAVEVDDLVDRLGDLPGGPWPEPARQAVVLPLKLTGHDQTSFVLVAVASSRRMLDQAYREFFTLLAAHIATVLSYADGRQQERRRADALEAADRAKNLFFANVSHELRTPLTLMLGPIEEMLGRSGSLDAGARNHAEVAQRNALRMLVLVNNLLDFARLEAGRLEAHFEWTDLGSLTSDLAAVFRSAIEQAGLTLRIDMAKDIDDVCVDRDMWEKIVLNLVSNALKFTFEGGIAVAIRSAETGVVLEISDTGIGIAAAEVPHIFERFRRVSGARSRLQDGTGIGLSLVEELVGVHGGRIDVASTPDVGTTFTVTIPRGADHLPADQVRIHPNRNGVPWSIADHFFAGGVAPDMALLGKQPELASAAKHVLIVDDNADMRAYLANLLSVHWRVSLAANGSQALELARREPPDLVLTDVMMPVLDGMGLLRAIRSDPALSHIPVVMLSARAGEGAVVEGLDAGADDYLLKPFSAIELVSRVRTNLEASEARLGWARQGEVDAMRLAEREHAIAVELQHAMLGRVDPIERLEVGVAYQASQAELEVGGDWYDVIELPDQRVALVVGDVVGHNLPAAAAMGQLRSAIRALASVCSGPAQLVARAEKFAGNIAEAAMSTMACAMLDVSSGALTYCCAGHPPPLVVRRDGTASYLPDGRTLPLGTGFVGARSEGSTTLAIGDALVLYTDGLVERRDEALDLGLERLRGAVQSRLGLSADSLCSELLGTMFVDSRQRDDVAVLVVRREPSPSFDRRIPARLSLLRELRAEVRPWLADNGVGVEDTHDLLVLAGEALANAVEHAYHGREPGEVEFSMSIRDEGVVDLVVRDFGTWRQNAAEGDRGRGIQLLEKLGEELSINATDDGTEVRVLKRLRSP